MNSFQLVHADCLDALRTMPENSVDSIVTDPPYGLEFMGKECDGADGFRRSLNAADTGRDNMFGRQSKRGPEYRAGTAFQEFMQAFATEALRVLKPGGHLLAFGGSRTYHRLACAIEDAGFEVRDSIMWLYGSGFPKSRNLSGEWQGWGTALKPAHEPIVVARKALSGTVAANVLAYGVGALNIDACRVDAPEGVARIHHEKNGVSGFGSAGIGGGTHAGFHSDGRWPANVIHDGSDEVRGAFPDAKGQQGDLKETGRPRPSLGRLGDMPPPRAHAARIDSDASAARFFYCAKASKSDRGDGNTHPTVKPTSLMRYLCRLVTPPGGTVLDPFTGSGSTGKAALLEGFAFIGIEREAEYIDIARARIGTIATDREAAA